MSRINFQDWIATEAPRAEKALDDALALVPSPCRPIASHILKAGGKRLRPLLVIAFARLLGYDDDDAYPLAASLELLHAATLLHDDILDKATSRRGHPAAHAVFGETKAILAGDAMLATGNRIAASYGSPEIAERYAQATALTASGEILEMDSLGNPNQTHGQYLEIAMNKTAALIAGACVIGAALARGSAEQKSAARAYGENAGLAFQIVDDALDFAPQSQTGKPRGGDLREGKLTPPIRLFRESLDENDRREFDKAFEKGEFSPRYFEDLVVAIEKFTPQTLNMANERIAVAKLALRDMPERDEKIVLEQMADYIAARHK